MAQFITVLGEMLSALPWVIPDRWGRRKYVITLLGEALKEETVQAAAKAIAAERVVWLKAGAAADLHITTEQLDRLIVQDALQPFLASASVDWIVQPVAHRRKKLFIADMDSTMITVECLDELADFVGKKAEVAAITERAMNGELDFAAALMERVAMLEGLEESALEQCYRERVKMMPGAKELLAALKKSGAHCVLVSGGFSFFTSRVRQELGFDEDYSNTLEVSGGKLTGRVIPPILGKEAKLETLQRIAKERGIALEDTLAIGDGANDVPMLLAAGLGVAYHAKPNVQAQVAAKINHGDLRALIWTQGL